MLKKFRYITDQQICSFIIFLCLIFIAFAMYLFRNPFYTEYTIEAGHPLTIDELLKEPMDDAKFLDEINKELLSSVGTHTIRVKGNHGTFHVELTIQDTIAPSAKVKKKTFWIGDKITADQFVSDIVDETNVKVSFKEKYDMNKEGKQNVVIVLKDDGQNITEYKTTITLKKDTTPPEISMMNTILSNKGATITYKKYATVTDNRDKEVELKVDSSQVNPNKEGAYYAIFSATDKAGNTATKKVKVIILNQTDEELKKEAQVLANLLIKSLTTRDMTKEEKLKACFDYIHENVVYNGQHAGTIDNYYLDAVNGMKTWRGDCLVSNGILRVVCECLDIPTTVVVRTSDRPTDHYWFLADTGDGWYHYDAFKRADVKIYKWTDDELLSWSEANQHMADFDTSLYPKTPKK